MDSSGETTMFSITFNADRSQFIQTTAYPDGSSKTVSEDGRRTLHIDPQGKGTVTVIGKNGRVTVTAAGDEIVVLRYKTKGCGGKPYRTERFNTHECTNADVSGVDLPYHGTLKGSCSAGKLQVFDKAKSCKGKA